MALTATTLSAAVAVNDNSIVVASATGFAAGSQVLVDQENMQVAQNYVSGTTIPVLRGRDGTATVAHKVTAPCIVELASDLSGPSATTTVQFPPVRARRIINYATAGAITLPAPGEDMVAIIDGTSTLAMTLANPTKDMDGSLLIIVANGKSASTVTYTAGFGNAGSSYDVITFQNAGQVSLPLIAANGIWVALNTPVTGTSTALSVAVA